MLQWGRNPLAGTEKPAGNRRQEIFTPEEFETLLGTGSGPSVDLLSVGEAVCLFLRGNETAQKWLARKEAKHGKGKALAILAAKLGRAIYHLLRKREPFDAARFWSS